jgi:hypothetical protein
MVATPGLTVSAGTAESSAGSADTGDSAVMQPTAANSVISTGFMCPPMKWRGEVLVRIAVSHARSRHGETDRRCKRYEISGFPLMPDEDLIGSHPFKLKSKFRKNIALSFAER